MAQKELIKVRSYRACFGCGKFTQRRLYKKGDPPDTAKPTCRQCKRKLDMAMRPSMAFLEFSWWEKWGPGVILLILGLLLLSLSAVVYFKLY